DRAAARAREPRRPQRLRGLSTGARRGSRPPRAVLPQRGPDSAAGPRRVHLRRPSPVRGDARSRRERPPPRDPLPGVPGGGDRSRARLGRPLPAPRPRGRTGEPGRAPVAGDRGPAPGLSLAPPPAGPAGPTAASARPGLPGLTPPADAVRWGRPARGAAAPRSPPAPARA